MPRPRQIDLPEDVREKLPESLGTLKHIKVLTNAEYDALFPHPRRRNYEKDGIRRSKAELQRKEKCRKGIAHRESCPFVVYDRNANYYTDYWYFYEPFTCLKHLAKRIPPWVCAECSESGVKSHWQINIGIAPIDTGDVELPSIHVHKGDQDD